MKKLIFSLFIAFSAINGYAQDSQSFKGYIYNKEYDVYIRMNFYEQDITVPNQEIFGNVAGFFGDNIDSRKWLFTSAEIKANVAHIAIINDYGSEDLEANLTQINDSTFELEQLNGSRIKIARNRKWLKLPDRITFTK